MTAKHDSPTAGTIYRNLLRVMAFLHRDLDPAKAWKDLGHDVSFPQFRTMMVLRQIGPCSLKELADALEITAASTSEMVERRSDRNDRRRIQLSLTPRAAKGVQRHEGLILKRIDALCERLGPGPANHWRRACAALDDLFDQQPSGGSTAARPR
ncbi:MAG: hypothetical protein BWZ08_00292 [candidate division BRC1 bacterium ADurb.BinA292]|nr:MAG: hypothetical protein BWZ08_00292 [candidate division BRC1 bacterium ADurb.BinA292]